MAVTRIKNNQITDASGANTQLGVNAAVKLQNYSVTAGKLANSLVYGSDLTVSGNLTVNGTTTTVDTINTLIKDPILVLADGQTAGTPTVDIGILGYRGNQNSSFLGWQETGQTFMAILSNTTVSNTTVNVSSYANFTASTIIAQANLSVIGNIVGAANFTGNVTAGNLISVALVQGVTVSASGNVIGGNVTTVGLISATGNVNGGNLISSALVQGVTVSATGNVIGGNVTTAGLISATGNISGGNISTAGNVTASYFIGNISGNIDAAGANTQVQFNDVGDILGASANFTFDKSTNVLTVSNGNVQGGNLRTGGLVSATGNITTSGNLFATSAANVTFNDNTWFYSGYTTLNTFGVFHDTGANPQTIQVSTNSRANGIAMYAAGTANSSIVSTGGINFITDGTLNANTYPTGGTSTAQITATGLTVSGIVSATGNVTGGNVLTGGLISATGNITGGNVTGTVISASGNVTSPVVKSTGAMTISTGSGDLTLNPTANVAMSSKNIVNLADPVQDQDAATKFYVDSVAQGLDIKASVLAATNTTLDSYSSGTVSYNNGTAGVGATLTTTGTYTTIDGANVQTANTRILIKNEGNATWNGIYVYSNSTVLTRSADFNQPAEVPGAYSFVESGNTWADTGWVCTTNSPVVFGTTNIVFAQFSGAGSYTANTAAGISLTGSVFSALVDNNTTAFDGGGNIIVKAGANLTTPNIGNATGQSLQLNTAGGNGLLLATTVSATGNAIAGNVTTVGLISATGTITSSANITGGNMLTGGLISATGTITSAANISGANVTTAGLITATGNITGGNVLTGGLVSATGNATSGNVLTGGLVSATGNITGGNLLTSGSGGAISGTGNITGGNILTGGLVSATGNVNGGNLISAALVQGVTVSASGNVIGGNVTTGGLISATGNLTAGNVNAGSGAVSTTGNVYAGNVINTGISSVTGNVIGGNILTGGLVSATGNGTFGNIVLTGNYINQLQANSIINVNGASANTNFAVNGTTANLIYVSATTNTVGIGNSATLVNAIASFNSTTSIVVPTGTLGQRPSNASSQTGMIRFNTTNNGLEIYDNTGWTSVGGTTFTVISDEQFNGDGANVAFTLGSSQTTNSCLVSINGVVQVPGSAYSVAGTYPTCVLTFTEAPAEGDLIDVREITTTTTVTAISNSSGNAQITGSPTTADLTVLGNLVPTANVTYTLGNATNYWKSLYVGGNTIYLGGLQLQSAAGNVFSVTTDGSTPANVNIGGAGNVITTGNVSGGNLITTSGFIVNGGSNGVGNIGSTGTYFNTVFAKATSAQYADLAEKYVADAEYAPGVVVSFGGDKEVTRSEVDGDRAVAGVVSTNPSYIMNATLEAEHVAIVAFTGRVPTSVTGTVAKGDLMVSNGDGTARAEADPKAGAIIGKALENFSGDAGVIEVVIGRF